MANQWPFSKFLCLLSMCQLVMQPRMCVIYWSNFSPNCLINVRVHCVLRPWSRKMFKNTFQSGFLSILYSIGSKPLQIWDKKVRNGHIKRITDNDIQSLVLEIVGTNVSTTYITCPADPKKTLGIKLPFLVMIIKNLKKYFTFEVQVRTVLHIFITSSF